LTEDPPPELVAGISFAGARGSTSADTVCGTSALIDAFRVFGMRARVPMMWVFAENDHFFGPALAAQLREAYVAHGARVDFRRVGAFGTDGHTLFSAAGRPIWTPLVDGFLEERKLQATDRLLPLPAPANLRPPRQLNASGRKEFEAYLEAPPHKAFALSAHGGYGYRTARRSDADARAQALAACEQARHAACQIYAVDDDYAR